MGIHLWVSINRSGDRMHYAFGRNLHETIIIIVQDLTDRSLLSDCAELISFKFNLGFKCSLICGSV